MCGFFVVLMEHSEVLLLNREGLDAPEILFIVNNYFVKEYCCFECELLWYNLYYRRDEYEKNHNRYTGQRRYGRIA